MNEPFGRVALAWFAGAALSSCALHPADLAAPSTAHLPARVELAQVPFFPQNRYQCGPAALATALQSAGVSVSPQDLSGEVYLPGKKGSLQTELIAAARVRDRVPYVLPHRLPALLEQLAAGRPVLVMQNLGLKWLPAWHFAVLIGYDLEARTLILRSGTTRRRVLDADRFLKTWQRAQHWAVVILEPDRLPAHAELDRYVTAVASLEATGRLAAAEQAYLQARQQWPHSVWPALGLANVRYRKGDLDAAEAGYRSSLALDPDNLIAHNNIAEILAGRGCVAEARLHVERATTLAKGTSLEAAVGATKQRVAASGSKTETTCPNLRSD